MKKKTAIFVSITLMLTLFIGAAFADGLVEFTFEELTSDHVKGWRSTDKTRAVGTTWRVCLYKDTIKNHGVGRVFTAGNYNWGSGLYTYNKNTYGLRDAKNYTNYAPVGTEIVWRMRGDDDYNSNFSARGYFLP